MAAGRSVLVVAYCMIARRECEGICDAARRCGRVLFPPAARFEYSWFGCVAELVGGEKPLKKGWAWAGPIERKGGRKKKRE